MEASAGQPPEHTPADASPDQATYVDISQLVKTFDPFRPPSPPVPMAAPRSFYPRTSAAMEDLAPHPRPVIRQPFLQRMRVRQEEWEETREEMRRQMWIAISVKRQRKLKMKK
jgi:hypothetical protein